MAKLSQDKTGQIFFTSEDGRRVSLAALVAGDAGAKAIAQAALFARKAYSEKVRPSDVHGNPGGLIVIHEGKRAIIVGDLHGRFDNLQHILKDKNNLRSILSGEAHLIFTGDAIHPRSSVISRREAYADSFSVLLLIMALKAEKPANVHYLIGNHDNAHVGGDSIGKGRIKQDRLFEQQMVEEFGKPAFQHYREFVKASPVAARVHTTNGSVLVIHAGLTLRVLNRQGLVNIFVKGRKGTELQSVLWNREFDQETIRKCLANVGAKFVISGHTNPTVDRVKQYGFEIVADGVFAHVHDLQVILNAQRNKFGYLDLDMTRPLPERVTDLCAPNGRSAFRVLRPKKRPAKPERS